MTLFDARARPGNATVKNDPGTKEAAQGNIHQRQANMSRKNDKQRAQEKAVILQKSVMATQHST